MAQNNKDKKKWATPEEYENSIFEKAMQIYIKKQGKKRKKRVFLSCKIVSGVIYLYRPDNRDALPESIRKISEIKGRNPQ